MRLKWTAPDGETWFLNLMDTPGHVDFSYEVSRSLAACEGAIAGRRRFPGRRGADAGQRLSGARRRPLEIIPVLNKIDLPAAEPERVRQQIEDVIGLDASGALPVSAKTGAGVEALIAAVVAQVPPPQGDPDAPLKALLVDSWYDPYLGVIILVRVRDGRLRKGQRIRMMATGGVYEADRVGVFTPKRAPVASLGPGEDRLHHRRHQDGGGLQGRRHHHRRPQPYAGTAARLPAQPAGGVLRHLPGR